MKQHDRIHFLTIGFACCMFACSQSHIEAAGSAGLGYPSMPQVPAEMLLYVLTYFAIALVVFRLRARVLPFGFAIASGVCLAAAQSAPYVLVALSVPLGYGEVLALRVATGASVACIHCYWSSIAYLMTPARFQLSIIYAGLAASLMSIFAFSVSSQAAIGAFKIIAIAVTLACAFALAKSGDEDSWDKHAVAEGEQGAPAIKAGLKDLITPSIAVGACGLVYRLSWGLGESSVMAGIQYAAGGAIAFAAVLGLIVFRESQKFDVLRLLTLLVSVAIASLVLVTLDLDSTSTTLIGVTSTCFTLGVALLMPLCTSVGRRRKAPIAGLYAVAMGVENIFPMIGWLARDGFYSLFALVVVSMFAVVLASLYLCVSHLARNNKLPINLSIRHLPSLATPKAAPPESEAEPRNRDVVILIGQYHALTSREQDILLLLLEGRNVPAISDKLVVSRNTVKSHIKSIYRKTGVHSRQELLDFVEKLFTQTPSA